MKNEVPKPQVDVIAFEIGDVVFHKCDPMQTNGLITGIVIRPGTYTYLAKWADLNEEEHYGHELTSSRGAILKEFEEAEDDE